MRTNIIKWAKIFIVVVAIFWILMTLWVESQGPAGKVRIGTNKSAGAALIVYDPDPIYNLDQQVCRAFGEGLAQKGWMVTVVTVRMAKQMKDTTFQLYVFCANTYNWWPDWSITNFIKTCTLLHNRNAIAITLGAGSTEHSQKTFNKFIIDSQGKLLGSKAFWLWKPNDETRLKESNTAVAVDLARKWGKQVGETLENDKDGFQ